MTSARPAGVTLDAWQVMSAPLAMRLEGYERHHTALSDRLFDVLREPLREHLPDPADYERAFDRFEYFKGLVHVDIEDAPPRKAWIPMGRYGWSEDWWLDTTPWTVADEVATLGPQWPPLQAGLFGGSHERLLAVLKVGGRGTRRLVVRILSARPCPGCSSRAARAMPRGSQSRP